jgi:hypothetical protein
MSAVSPIPEILDETEMDALDAEMENQLAGWEENETKTAEGMANVMRTCLSACGEDFARRGALVRWFAGFMTRSYAVLAPVVHAVWPHIVKELRNFVREADPGGAPVAFLRDFMSLYLLSLDCREGGLIDAGTSPPKGEITAPQEEVVDANTSLPNGEITISQEEVVEESTMGPRIA